MSDKRSTLQRSLRTLGLLSLLVLFPLTSWYFLQTGLNFTKDKYDKMEELAQVDSFVMYPLFGDSITNQTILGRMSIIANPGTSTRFLDSLSLIHEDLVDEEWVWLFILSAGDVVDDKSVFSGYPFLLDSSAVKLVNGFQYKEGTGMFGEDIDFKPYELGLIDTKGVLRYKYDIRKQDQLDLFISHLVLLVPKE